MRNRTRLIAAAVILLLLSLPPLLSGLTMLYFAHPPFGGPAGLGDDVFVYDQSVTVGGVTLTGEWAWIVPLIVGSGGLIGGGSLLVWAWRSKPPVGEADGSRDRQGAR